MNADAVARLTIQWVVPSSQATSIVAALQATMTATRQERGCRSCSLATEAGGERVALSYGEVWATERDLQRHVDSERFSLLAGLLEAGVAPPVVEFALPSGVRGLDYALEVRVGRGEALPPLAGSEVRRHRRVKEAT